jgi:septum formation protein
MVFLHLKHPEASLPVYFKWLYSVREEVLLERIILASGSPRRQQLLKQVGLNFDVIPADIDETMSADLSPIEMVQFLADQKACVVADRLEMGIVIAADTIVVLDGRVMGKPESDVEASEMLSALNGRHHQVMTGICILNAHTGKKDTAVEVTEVAFRKLCESEIKAYVKSGEPFDKAGGYGIQGLGALLVESIQGCYFNVVGLPLNQLGQMLKGQGIELLGR